MNILYTIRDLHIGGTANVLLQNVSILSKHHNVYLVYFGNNSTMLKRFAEFGVEPILIEHKNYLRIFETILSLRKIVKKKKIDIVHANLFLDKVVVPFACLGTKVKKIATLHSAIDPGQKLTIKKKLSVMTVFFLLNNFYDAIIAVSASAKFSAEKIGKLKKNKAIVLYSGVNPIQKLEISQPVFPKDSIVIGTSCRFDPVKGLPRLIRIFSKIRQQIPNIRLLLIGDGKERLKIEQEIKERGMENDVFITGFTKVDPYLNQIHFYVNSSFSEALGLGTIEALSLSKPIIASNVGGLKEYIENDINGILVDFDREAIAVNKIEGILNLDKERYLSLSENAKATFERKFSISNYKENLLQIYRGH